MRVLVYPQSGYISVNLVGQLKDGASWSAALQQAAAVFHVLHGHEQHAKQTLLQLLQSTTPQAPVTFVGISTPLTWAATPAAPPPPPAAAAAPQTAEPAEQQGPAQEDPPSSGEAASSAGRFTAEDAPKRRPAASAVGTFHCEQLVLRANRPGRLHTHVVCPGILYGCGEADDQLHGLWRQAWEGQTPLQVHGSGANRLPTIHVQDLAAFCEALVLQQQLQLQEAQAQAALTQQGRVPQQHQPQRQQGRYLLASDAAPVTQRQLVAAVGQLLVHSQLRSDSPSLLGQPVSPVLLLDLPFSCSPLAQPYFCCCPHGLLGHLPQVLQELLAARNLSPLRILIRGPPAAGKTHLGMRLAQLYGLLHVNAATILAQLQHMDAETQKAANAQLNSREGRLSPQLMARLVQHLLLKHPTALKQGWVLEGWPRSLSAALLATFVSAAGSGGSNSSSSGGAEVAGKAGGRRDSTGSLGVKADKRRSTATSSGGAAGGGGRGRRTQGDEELEAGEGLSLQCPDLMPHFLIELDVSEEELQARVKALAAAEAAQAAATAAADASAARAANGTSNGSSKKAAAAAAAARPSTVGTVSAERAGSAVQLAAAAVAPSGPYAAAHNNLKDWGRRMEAYRQVVQEDAADLASKRATVVAAYQAQLAAEAAAAAAAAATTAAAGGSSKDPQAAAKASSKPPAADKAGGAATGGSSRMGTPRTHGKPSAAGTDGCQLPPDVTLPEHGGFVAYFVEGGARHLKVSNPTDSTVAASTFPPVMPSSRGHTPRQAVAAAAQSQQPAAAAACTESSAVVLPLVSLEQQLLPAVGPPHNYVGLPEPSTCLTTPAAAAAAAAADTAAGDSGSAAGAAASQAHGCSAAACAAAAAGPLARRAAGESASLPDMGQLQAAAEALAAEAAVRDASQVCQAARPLSAALMESLMGDLMAGLVAVALDRPADPCQVIAERLLEGAARQKAAYQDPYADPMYAIQLGKVKAKEAREAARTVAAAAKAARDAAAAAAATGAAEAAGVTAAAVADCGSSLGDGSAGASVGSKPVGAACDRPPSSKAAGQKGSGRVAGGRAGVAHAGTQSAR